MKAAILVGKERFEVKDVKRPRCEEGEVLVRVRGCAICGSDLRIFHGEKSIDVPITGHEISGTVEEIGEGVKDIALGDRVVIETVVGCGECEPCKGGEENHCLNKFEAIGHQYNGGFAQFALVPKRAVKQGCIIKIPENLSFDEATLVEPLSCVINGWKPIKIEKGFTVVVIGAGMIGMLHSELAKLKGAKVILVNRSAPRLELAKRIGLKVDEFIDLSKVDLVKKVRELTGGKGANVVVCACSSKEAQRQALEIAAVDADISYFAGISKTDPLNEVNTNLIHYNELHVHGANSSSRKHYVEAIKLISSQRINVKKFITHRFPLEKIEEAIRMLEDRETNALKVVIDPWI